MEKDYSENSVISVAKEKRFLATEYTETTESNEDGLMVMKK